MRRSRPHGRRLTGAALSFAAALLLALMGIGFGGATAGATSLPPINYSQCPTFTDLQTAIGNVADGDSQAFTFAPGLDCTYVRTNADASNYVTGKLTINDGAGVTINGNGLTIEGGTADEPGDFSLIAMGSGSSLTLDRASLLYGKQAIDVAGVANPSITLTNSTLKSNHNVIEAYTATGITISVTSSTLSSARNSTIDLIGATDQTTTVTDSMLSGSQDGINESISTNANITVTGSTIVGYSSAGIDIIFATSPTITVTDSTITGPTYAIGANFATSPTITITSSTLVSSLHAIASDPAWGQPSFTVTATILAGSGASPGPNCTVAITDGGYNLSASADGSDNSCGFQNSTTSKNVTTTELNLQPLASNGGPTQTTALGPGSVAIDAIPVSEGECVAGEQVDQRGVARPQGLGCDAGAYEAANSIAPLSGSTTTVRQGFYALIRIEALSPSGQNISSRDLKVASAELDGPDGQQISFVHQFQFGRFSGQRGYQLTVNTRNLTPGTWTLVVQIGSGMNAAAGSITFTVQ